VAFRLIAVCPPNIAEILQLYKKALMIENYRLRGEVMAVDFDAIAF